jgi:hypothetical protein
MRHLAALLLLPALLTGCGGSEVLTLGADEVDITACAPGQTFDVEDLDTVERPACTPVGSELLFPDGTRLEMAVDSVAGSSSSSESRFSHGWYDVGIYGVVASRYDQRCSELQVWGRSEAIDKLREAFGDNLGSC